jgi:hypothetical protein
VNPSLVESEIRRSLIARRIVAADLPAIGHGTVNAIE